MAADISELDFRKLSAVYGVEDGAWFASFHAFDRYLKVAFYRGASLDPAPPVASKHKDVRYFHIHEDETVDEVQLADVDGARGVRACAEAITAAWWSGTTPSDSWSMTQQS